MSVRVFKIVIGVKESISKNERTHAIDKGVVYRVPRQVRECNFRVYKGDG